MTSREAVSDFLSQKSLALVGMSRRGKKFGNTVYKELKARGYAIYPVHPAAESIQGDRCWPSLRDLPEPVGGVVIVVPPAETEKIVRDAAAAGIPRVWMQQGSQSPEAVRYCEEHRIKVVQRECILMFAEPVTSIHRFHRWLWGIFGKLPR